ncbi:hypothetical protein HETIRDRAFT_449127 [Heterobasidion irregulare TC 32-1]|uniref:Uncharacterized protein n=1 Tax=Heterobasidion irregulare (strain TC 32-1) TaxID=747525 RepID=W4KKL7_HETIT|nr:uncharacterized protein HETIRDRAFT_449127 [Heterobasidion irregulare TC 32-1]ETW86259.1 hypothetical protein HETIRDRAFT_449127 [Heterobasidion irregulare TC 32-1]
MLPAPAPGPPPHLFPYPAAPSILHSANLSVISRPFLGLSLLLFVSSSAPRTASSPASKTPVPPTPASAHPHLLPHTLPTVSYSQLNTAPAPCAPAPAHTHTKQRPLPYSGLSLNLALPLPPLSLPLHPAS